MIVESFSGIRGIYGQGLDEDVARKYTQAFVSLKRIKRAIIAMDTRPSSHIFKKAMSEVLLANGCEVIDISVAPTPAAEFAVREYGADAGIMITGSHNEPEYNGFKFLDKDGAILRPKDAERLIRSWQKAKPKVGKAGTLVDKHDDLINRYIEFVIQSAGISSLPDINVIVDPNGGTACPVLKRLFDRLGAKMFGVNMQEGKFNRLLEPNAQSLAYLVPELKKRKADLAAGFDSDADRVEFVLPAGSDFVRKMGNMLSGNYILALLVDQVLSGSKKGATIVTNDATSKVVSDIAGRYGAKVKEVEVGEINVVDEMYKRKSPVGGEGSSSGGIFPPSRCRDGILTLVMILKLISERKKPLSEILEHYPEYYNVRTKVIVDAKDAPSIKGRLRKGFKKAGYSRFSETGDETGGLKVRISDDSWIWFRGSKTELGVYRIIADAPSKEEANRLLRFGEEVFNKIGNI